MNTVQKLNYEARDYISIGPNFVITTNDPRENASSPAVFHKYAFTKENNQFNEILDQSGSYKILNDKGIEIAAGNKGSDGVDVCINALNGDITITAMSNGVVKIRAKHIMLEAVEDLDLKAGRNVNINAGSGRIKLEADKIDEISVNGNAVTNSFVMRAFCLCHNYDAVCQIKQGQDLLSSILKSVGII
jgi:hypothetical protein